MWPANGAVCLSALLALTQAAGKPHPSQKKPYVVSVSGYPVSDVDTSLFKAIEAHDVAKVKMLLAKGASPNSNEGNGLRPLLDIDVGEPSCIAIASVLLKAGAHINYVQADQMTTPLTAFNMRNTAYAKFLLSHGADPNLIGYGGQTPLEQAVLSDNPELVRLLIGLKADVNKRSKGQEGEGLFDQGHLCQPNFRFGGETPMFGLAAHWSAQVYGLLVGAGADPKAMDVNGWSLLDRCVAFGNVDGARYLLSHGANPNDPSTLDYTSLHLAMNSFMFPNPEVVRLLMANGANRSVRTYRGKTAEDLLQSRVKDYLTGLKVAKADQTVQKYLELSNEMLKAIDPHSEPMGLPKIDTSQWMAVDSASGYDKVQYRAVREASRTRLLIRLPAPSEPTSMNLSNLYLDYYESIGPGPFRYTLAAGKPFETSIDFPPAAGQAGNLVFVMSQTSKDGGAAMDHRDQRFHLEPVVYWKPGAGLVFQNYSPDRSEEVVVESLTSKGKIELPLNFVLAPGQEKAVPGTAVYGSYRAKYRSRLLPNRRWIENKGGN